MKAKKTKNKREGVGESGSGSERTVELSFRIPPFSQAKAIKKRPVMWSIVSVVP